MGKIQNILFQILNALIIDLSNIKENSRKMILTIAFLLISILTWSNRVVGGHHLRYAVITIIGCVLLYVVIALIFPKKCESRRINCPIAICWAFMSVFMVISALLHRIDNVLLPFVLLFVFPFMWFIESRMENDGVLIESAAKGIMISFLLFFFLSLIFAPITVYQYTGIFTNCNGTSQYLTAVLPCILYLSAKENKIHYLIYIAFLCTIMFYTRSRTGLISGAAIFAVWILIEGKARYKAGKIKKFLKKLIIIAVLIILVIPIFWGLNRCAMYTVQDKFCLNAYEEIMRERGQSIYDMSFDDSIVGLNNRVVVGDRDINAYSSGRIAIWKDYMEELNLSGHAAYNGEFSQKHSTAHNTFLQITYDYGIIVGIMYFINIICLFIGNMIHIWRYYSHETLFVVMVMSGYMITALLASCVFPFAYLITFLFYLGLYKPIYLLEKQGSYKRS